MKIIFTEHALERIERRGIAARWVEDSIRQPQWREPDPHDGTLERLYRSIPELGNRVLRVIVCWTSEEECRVITAFPDRGAAIPKAEHKMP
jgi:hypothetical protein